MGCCTFAWLRTFWTHRYCYHCQPQQASSIEAATSLIDCETPMEVCNTGTIDAMPHQRKVCQAVGCITKAQTIHRGYCAACLRKKFPKLYVEKHASEGTCIVCSSQEARHDLNLFRRCRSCFSKEDPYLQRKMVSAESDAYLQSSFSL